MGILLLSVSFSVKCLSIIVCAFVLPVLVGILFLNVYFSVKCFVDLRLSLCPSVLSGDLVAHSLLLCEVFCRSLFVPLSFRS